MPEAIQANDVICDPSAVKEEESEIEIEMIAGILSPLSRPVPEISLMASATIALSSAGGAKKDKKKAAGGDDKLINALTALSREDLALKVEQNSGQWVVRCMSKDHLHLLVERLKNRYDVEVELGETPVAYRETLAKAVRNVEGKHKKQSGGSGQFGVCYISMEPLEEGSGIVFESQIKGGVLSKTFINSVEKGVYEQLRAGGPTIGAPVTDVKVILTDGKMHSVDSKDIAFQSAGKQAVKNALKQGGTVLLQPMEKVTFVVDEHLQGDINGTVSRSDGYVTDSSPTEKHMAKVEAILPAACIAEISETLRAESAGEGQYSSVFSHYQSVPGPQVKTIRANLQP
jgi:elongation factor G